MKALLLTHPNSCTISIIETPVIKDDEVLIKIKASGICTNDIRDFNGDSDYSYPRIGGHEYCGVIEKLGKDVNSKRYSIGQKVVSYIIDDCQECYYCRRREENICEKHCQSKRFYNPKGISGYGGFAEFIAAKANDVFVYTENASFEKMVYTEPLACVVNSINRANIQLGDDVLIIGGGTMGLLHLMVAKLKGANVIISEPLNERRGKALQLGASHAFDPFSHKKSPIKQIQDLTEGRGANVVFNTSANPLVAEQAVEMTAPGGICIMFSSLHPNNRVPINCDAVHSYQKTVTGVVSPSILSYHQSVLLISKKIVDPTVLTERIFDYTEFEAAMALAKSGDSFKVILKFGDIQ